MTFAVGTTFDVRFNTGSDHTPRFDGKTVMAWLRARRDQWLERRRQVKAIRRLRELDDHMLRDIGIDRSEIASAVIHGRRGRR